MRRPRAPLAVELLADSDGVLPPLFTASTDVEAEVAVPAVPASPAATQPLEPSDTPGVAELHARIYHLTALALRAYLASWYTRLSPREPRGAAALLPTVTRDVVVPLVGPLLARPTTPEGAAALCDLVLVHLPTLLATHVETYHAAQGAVASGLARGEDGSRVPLDAAYHARLPLLSTIPPSAGTSASPSPSPSPNPSPTPSSQSDPHSNADPNPNPRPAPLPAYTLNPAYTTALVDAFLALRLPPPDLAADAERLAIREVVARSVLLNIGRRLAAPWFWAQICLKLIRPPPPPREICHDHSATHTFARGLDTAARAARALLAVVLLLWNGGAWVLATLQTCPPARERRVVAPWLALGRAVLFGGEEGGGAGAMSVDGDGYGDSLDDAPTTPRLPPPLTLRVTWTLVEATTTLLSPALDTLLPHLFTTYLLTPRVGLRIVGLLERVLFPNGWPTPAPPDPTPEEAAALDAQLRERLAQRWPAWLGKIGVLPRHVLTPFTDAGCNAHLVAMVYDAAFAALVPELVEGGRDVKVGNARREVIDMRVSEQPKPESGAKCASTDTAAVTVPGIEIQSKEDDS